MSSASGSPAYSSSAVKLAIEIALATVSSTAAGERFAVLAEPLRWPAYTVTPRLRSRWYSRVSTSPRRTVTDSPVDTPTPASAAVAPLARASASACSTTCSSAFWSGWVAGVMGPPDCTGGRAACDGAHGRIFECAAVSCPAASRRRPKVN